MQMSVVIADGIGALFPGKIEKRSRLEGSVIRIDPDNLDSRGLRCGQGQLQRHRDDEFVVILEVQHKTVAEPDSLHRTVLKPMRDQFLFDHVCTLDALRWARARLQTLVQTVGTR